MTAAARAAIAGADHVVGYKPYLALIKPLIGETPATGFGMRREIDRVAFAVKLAQEGGRVALVCSGDAGVYGMAGLCFEYLQQKGVKRDAMPHIVVLPGVTSAQASASLVGAPLMHDSAQISLSDLLTPWEVIAKRIEAAASADFVITFYNPASTRRAWQLGAAASIIARYRAPTTPVAVVASAYRPGGGQEVSDLASFLQGDIGMHSTVIVGNSQTYVYEGFMVTPRGYAGRYFQDDAPEEQPLDGQGGIP